MCGPVNKTHWCQSGDLVSSTTCFKIHVELNTGRNARITVKQITQKVKSTRARAVAEWGQTPRQVIRPVRIISVCVSQFQHSATLQIHLLLRPDLPLFLTRAPSWRDDTGAKEKSTLTFKKSFVCDTTVHLHLYMADLHFCYKWLFCADNFVLF